MRQFQSTLPTRGSDDSGSAIMRTAAFISIHAPHEGERRIAIGPSRYDRLFQSTLPTRGSDVLTIARPDGAKIISIHAPHEGERR